MKFEPLQLMIQKTLILFAVLFFWSQLLFSQGITTGSIQGRITDSNSTTIGRCVVIAVHISSGTKYATISQDDGRFSLANVRVGGPYTIVVTNMGFEPYEITDAHVGLGEVLTLNIQLKDKTFLLQEVVIKVDSKNNILNSKKNGAGTVIDRNSINNLPSISRSLKDFTRLSPQAGAQGMLGKGSKSNFISVDGAAFNNSFGLGLQTSDLPGANVNAQPISLDAIDQIAVNLSPYSVKEGGFTGASINIVTWSGDNTFRGSIYDLYRNQNLVGSKVKDVTIANTPFHESTIGFRLGGPIIKDKLFFFTNYEQFSNIQAGANYVAATPGNTGSNVSNFNASDLNALSSYLQTTYHYNPGDYQDYNLPTQNKKFLVKLDWNIDTKNKLSVRYNQLTASNVQGAISTISSAGFSNNGFLRHNDIYSITGELNSNLSNKISNRVFASYNSLPDYRQPLGDITPYVMISDNGKTYQFGTSNAAVDNNVVQHIFQLQDDITFALRGHNFSAGVSYQGMEFDNNFTLNPQGTYTFSSLANFYNSSPAGTVTPIGPSTGAGLPYQYSLSYTVQPGRQVTYTQTKVSMLGFYLQDEVFPIPTLKFTGGIRFDVISFIGIPATNTTALNYTFQDAYGNPEHYSTGTSPGNSVLFSPRIGFNWDLIGDRTLQLRGGSGIFSGNIPFVYLTNARSMNGLNENSIAATTPNTAAAYPYNPNPQAYIPPNKSAAAQSELDFVSKDFKMPQTWRSTLALDYKLPANMVATLEGVYSKDYNAPFYTNVNFNSSNTATAADGRLAYTSSTINPNVNGGYLLSNVNIGRQLFLTASLNKQFSTNWMASVSYNYGNSKDAFDFRSTTASSAFNATPVVGNTNLPVLGYTDFDLRHRVVGNATYRFNYFKDKMTSSLGIFLEVAQQGRGSYTYAGTGDVNQDGIVGNDLIFIPKDQSQINLVASPTATVQKQWNSLNNYINNSTYLSSHRGQFAERNGVLLPWYFQADLKFAQDLSILFGKGKNTLEITADILNVTNLIDKNWGVLKTMVNPTPITALSPTTFQVNPALLNIGEFTEDTNLNSTINPASSSRYRIQFGVKYSFN